MRPLSIRWRLTLWYTGILFVGLALFGTGTWFAVRQRLMAGLDERLDQRIEGLRTVLITEAGASDRAQVEEELTEYAQEIPEGNLMDLRSGNGDVLLTSAVPRASEVNTPGSERLSVTRWIGGKPYRVLASSFEVKGATYRASVAGSLEEVLGVLRELRNLMLLLTPLVLLSAACGGYWISRSALDPVDEITTLARSISIQNLSRRLAVPQTGDELQRMSETWNDVLERLEAAVEHIRQFTADASHELRTPIALIRTTAELALRRPRPLDDYRQALLQIQREAEHMTELAESLLVLARSDARSQSVDLAPVDLNQIVNDVSRRTEPAARDKGVHLTSDTLPAGAIVQADAFALRRLLTALVDNALKHTSPGDSVTISTSFADGGILLSVRDTGEGIPPADLPYIFERFFRVDTARARDTGAGLGLAIAQAIATAHGTKIDVESVLGSGSQFRLLLRLAASQRN